MKFTKAAVVASLAALAMLGAVVPAQAGTAGEQRVAAVAAERPAVTVHLDDGANGFQVANAISQISEDNRGAFVERSVGEAFRVSGSRFNVIMMNLSQGYSQRLERVRFYANIQYGSVHYGLWIAEAGEFTNHGDGGYINWAYRGWFTRSGGTVRFHRP